MTAATDAQFARLLAGGRHDLGVIERLWPVVRRLRQGQSPLPDRSLFGPADTRGPELDVHDVEDDDLRALLEGLRALDDLHQLRHVVERSLGDLNRARRRLERRAPALAGLLAEKPTTATCTVPGCSRPAVRSGLCRACESSWQAWRTRYDRDDLATWRAARAERLEAAG